MTVSPKRMLILGLGESGLAMTRIAVAEGWRLRAADSRSMLDNAGEFARMAPTGELVLGDFPAGLLADVDCVAISPGLSLNEPLVQRALQRGIEVVGEIELFARHLVKTAQPAQVVAITGTNGKSTVTSMLGEMAIAAGRRAKMAGNISPAAANALRDAIETDSLPELWVLELSSFQLETTYSLPTNVATVLNVTEDHLDRYDGMDDYAATKARIFDPRDCVQVLNRQDPRVSAMAQPGRRVITFGLDTPPSPDDYGMIELAGASWLVRGKKPILPRVQLPHAGDHSVLNTLAALALGEAIGLPLEPMVRAVQAYRGLPHRVEKVASLKGIDFFDDSKGTNVGATLAALKGLGRKVVLIAGGDGKGQDFSPLRDAVAKSARAVVLIGQDAPLIESAIAGCGVPVHHAKSMEEAVSLCWAEARLGDAILLSPACASFGMFRNYHHRGEVFTQAVQALRAGEGGA